MPEDYITK